jgi:hypothetical protein
MGANFAWIAVSATAAEMLLQRVGLQRTGQVFEEDEPMEADVIGAALREYYVVQSERATSGVARDASRKSEAVWVWHSDFMDTASLEFYSRGSCVWAVRGALGGCRVEGNAPPWVVETAAAANSAAHERGEMRRTLTIPVECATRIVGFTAYQPDNVLRWDELGPREP